MKSHLHAQAITRIPVRFQEANAGQAGVVTMSFTCHLQSHIHPCYHSDDFTVAVPEITYVQWIPQMHEIKQGFMQMMAIVPCVYLWASSKSGKLGRHSKVCKERC